MTTLNRFNTEAGEKRKERKTELPLTRDQGGTSETRGFKGLHIRLLFFFSSSPRARPSPAPHPPLTQRPVFPPQSLSNVLHAVALLHWIREARSRAVADARAGGGGGEGGGEGDVVQTLLLFSTLYKYIHRQYFLFFFFCS